MYLLDKLKSLTGWLNLVAAEKDNSKRTGANSLDAEYRFQYSTLIEASDLHRDCYQSSYCPMPINEKCVSIQNLQYVYYIDKINQNIQRTWSSLYDCYWLVLTSTLSELNAYLPSINSEWIEKDAVRRLQEHDRRLQREMSRMVSAHERQQAVLKRRIEVAAAAERRLKELLLRQKDVKQERDKRPSEVNNPTKVS
ncbi:unnamed protein product [Trichobilharzia szidati]|nr:unnamed protein product [Trichobilharzia szidati]